jgi:hypothetical protein
MHGTTDNGAFRSRLDTSTDNRPTGSSMTHSPYAWLRADRTRLCFIAALFSIIAGATQQVLLWQLDANGISIIGERLPYWDFSNLWAGSLMALHGQVRTSSTSPPTAPTSTRFSASPCRRRNGAIRRACF